MIREIDSPCSDECVAVGDDDVDYSLGLRRPEDLNERNKSHQHITASQPVSSAGFSFHLLID
jgi:hypothetical protein